MKVIVTLKKKGLGAVVLTQGVYSSGETYYTITVNGVTTSLRNAGAMNSTYIQYRKAGWEANTESISEEVEEKVAAPKPTREDALTEKYGDKDARREYCIQRDKIRFEVASEIRDWVKTHRGLSKDEYKKVWNDEVQKRLSQWQAEKVAIGG